MTRTFQLWVQVDHWHDGDTFHGLVDLGHNHMHGSLPDGARCRIVGIDTPELPTPAGLAALAHATELAPPGLYHYLSDGKNDQHGRPLLNLLLPDGTSFGDRMIADGHAVTYKPTRVAAAGEQS